VFFPPHFISGHFNLRLWRVLFIYVAMSSIATSTVARSGFGVCGIIISINMLVFLPHRHLFLAYLFAISNRTYLCACKKIPLLKTSTGRYFISRFPDLVLAHYLFSYCVK
jgi:hypothetical protein